MRMLIRQTRNQTVSKHFLRCPLQGKQARYLLCFKKVPTRNVDSEFQSWWRNLRENGWRKGRSSLINIGKSLTRPRKVEIMHINQPNSVDRCTRSSTFGNRTFTQNHFRRSMKQFSPEIFQHQSPCRPTKLLCVNDGGDNKWFTAEHKTKHYSLSHSNYFSLRSASPPNKHNTHGAFVRGKMHVGVASVEGGRPAVYGLAVGVRLVRIVVVQGEGLERYVVRLRGGGGGKVLIGDKTFENGALKPKVKR